MADGKIVVTVDADAKKAQKELDTLSAKIDKMEAKLNEDTGTQSGIKKELDAALQAAKQTEDALKSLRSEADRLKGITSGNASANPAEYIDAYSRQAEVAAQIKEQEQLLVQQNKTAEKLGSQYAKITDKVINQTAALDAAKTKAGELVQQITNASGASAKMAEVSASVEKSMNKFGRRLSGVLRSALIFTVLSRGLSQLRSWLSETIKKSDEARAAVARLKGALLTLAQPIMKVVIPAFILLVNVLTRIVNALATLVSKLFGTSFPKSAAEAAAAYGDEAEAISDVGDAAKKAGKSMASFDEINQLSNDSGSSGGAGAGGGIGSDTIAPDFSAMIKDQLTSITELFVGAALLALGAILTFSGANIPLGIALMAVGALAVWDAVSNHWGEIAGILQGQVGLITAIVSTALLAIGAILVFSGANIPLGLGLMIAGAVGLAATVAANWGSITEALQGPIGIITAIVSGALLVVGAILAFTGASLPLGIGLMAAGAIGLAATAAVNWNTIQEKMKGPLGKITAIVGGALLALGAVLLFTGAGIPLGLGLLAAGGVSLAAAIAPNWDFIVSKVKDCWGKIKDFWKKNIAPVFTGEWWANLAKNAMNGLIAEIESGINRALGGLGGLVNGAIRLLNKVPGVDIGNVSWGNVQLPRLASGAVIPPNREFMAVLGDQKSGTNIETPLATMVQAFKQAMNETGVAGSRQMTVIFQLDRRELGRTIYQLNNEETQRVGVKLAGVKT